MSIFDEITALFVSKGCFIHSDRGLEVFGFATVQNLRPQISCTLFVPHHFFVQNEKKVKGA